MINILCKVFEAAVISKSCLLAESDVLHCPVLRE